MLKVITSPIEWILPKLPNVLTQKMLSFLPLNRIQHGSITVQINNQTFRFEGQNPGVHAELKIQNLSRFYWLMKTQGELGFAQAYIDKIITTNSLYHLLTFGEQNREKFGKILSNKKSLGWWHLWRHRRRHNSVKNSRKNISAHYDLGNSFYRLWLDSTMSYSSALYRDYDEPMEQAQNRKYQALLDQLKPQPGQKLLEIGCGWGGFAEIAALNQLKVKGLTLSHEQRAFAEERMQNIGQQSNVEIALQDYRHETEQYDHIVSIEMFEAVGKEYWQDYFNQLQKNLKPGGRVALQIITIDDDIADHYQNGVDFIQTYIFPGGLLPSFEQLKELCDQHGFEWLDEYEFGLDYAETLNYWLKRFNANTSQLDFLGYDERFRRLWRYYLDYCRVGFEQQHIQVYHILLQKPESQSI